MQAFKHAGFFKYDDYYPFLDEGVQALRDVIIATEAAWYITCNRAGGHCGVCSWSSTYVQQAIDIRTGMGKPTNSNWAALTSATLLPPL